MTTTTEPIVPSDLADTEWIPVCDLHELPYERGVAALVHGVQIALFRTLDDSVFAVQQHDPYCGAMVISRGLVGTRGPVATVASPMYKQVFDLATGACLEPQGKEPIALRTWSVLVRGTEVAIGITARTEGEVA